MRNFEAIKRPYQAIYTHEDFVAPFVEFCQRVRTQAPDVETLVANSMQWLFILGMISGVREMRTYSRGEDNGRYFRGSGIVIVGNSEGLQAVGYRAESSRLESTNDTVDPVAEQYGPYQHVALEKVGKAALVSRLLSQDGQLDDMYFKLNDILVDRGLQDPEIPHHIGYAYGAQQNVVVGASGMLPSESTAATLKAKQWQRFAQDRHNGWVTRGLDEFAGFYDQVAAESVISSIASSSTVVRIPLLAVGVNYH